MTTKPVPLKIPPGVIRTLSQPSIAGRYYDVDKVRFVNGKVEKIGGWEKLIDEALIGIVRGMLGWSTEAGDDVVAAGTYLKAYSVSSSAVDDITPLRDSGTLGVDPFAVVISSTTVTVTDVAHGLDVGARVHFSGASAGGGITINGEYAVVTVPGVDSYTITHSIAASSSDSTTGGAAVAYEYEINPGTQGTTYGLGWGAGPYGDDTWGTPRDFADAVELEARYWWFARFGSFLAMLPSGGTVYLWDQPNNDDRAVAVSGAPSSARAMFITPERMIVMLGTTTAMTMEWNDREDETNWTPGEETTANNRTLQAGNRLMAGSVFSSFSVVWTDTAIYRMQFLGSDGLIYETDVIAEGCGLIGSSGFARSPGAMFWMSQNNFFMYAGGGVEQIPRCEEIRAFIFDRLDSNAAFLVAAGYNKKHNEIWWHYASTDGDGTAPDSYVKVNLNDYSWDFGTMERTAMSYQDSPTGDVVMAGADMFIYRHEVGKNDDGAAMEAFAENGVVAIDPARDVDLDGYIPDFERQVGTITLTLFSKFRPMSVDELERQSFDIAEGDDLVDIQLGGRYVGRRITSNEVDGDFREGTPLVEIGLAGDPRI